MIWEPKDIIGGDLYWFKGDGDSFLVGVIDCTGHGVPGAIMTMIAGTTLGRVVNEIGPSDPAKILVHMNDIIRQTLSQHMEETESNDGLDVGLCYVKKGSQMIYAGANISLFILSCSNITEIRGNRQSVGYKSVGKNTVFSNHELIIEDGMTFYMATDGIKDQVGGDKRLPFGKSRLLNLLISVQGLPFKDQKEAITSSIEIYSKGEIRRDDITLIGFEI
ncbi:hypothetical protein N752_31265 [Desulforamulus aquiferis]|nr:SpoIIE family protein phosphatase [Desulforamulus aquiferis]RYD01233.1 hypothetical protein N752_31265 [Desulforamulus aquiferis]